MIFRSRSSELVQRLGVDPWIAAIVSALAFSGVALSASARAFEDAAASVLPVTLGKSLLYLLVGFVVLSVAMLPDYRKLAHPLILWIALIFTSALLIVALAAPDIANTNRWIRIFGISLQPSELAKPVLVVTVAAALARAGDSIRNFSGLARALFLGGLLGGLVLLGRDLGTPVMLRVTAIVMAVCAGASWRHTSLLAVLGSIGFALASWIEPYRMARLTKFAAGLDVSPGALDKIDYQLRQSILAIGSGGVVGKGFGASSQKAHFLPEADNDFVFAIIAEELGMIGAAGLLLAFLVLAWRGLRTAEHAPDELGRLIAIGATWLLCFQALCHMGVVTGVLPTKGLPLPFLSSGGSSLLASFALVGLLLNVSLRRRRHVA